jgi:uncharacterized membrane protein YdcZ (DUF606 family)
MKHKLFIRNVRAREQLEYFILSGISSVLLLRYYLFVTGYPQIGSDKLHISHMLWGGVLMLTSIVFLLSFLGRRLQRLAAVIGGVGFGVFIDEVGKFVTQDNNYFFRPSVGIIYAVFVLLYVAVGFITRNEKLSSREYQLNALSGLEEAVLREMDEREKTEVRQLLARANPHNNVTKQLSVFLESVTPNKAPEPNALGRFRARMGAWYDHAWQNRASRGWVRVFFVLQILFFAAALVLAIGTNVDNIRDFFYGKADYGHSLVVGQAVATGLSAWFTVVGLYKLRSNRVSALEWFRLATLVNLLLTEFFIFSRIQFGAMPSFIGNLLLYLLINAALTHERRSLKGVQ